MGKIAFKDSKCSSGSFNAETISSSFSGVCAVSVPLAGTSGRLVTSVLSAAAGQSLSSVAVPDRKQGSVSCSVPRQSPQWSDMARSPSVLTLLAALLVGLSAQPSKILTSLSYWRLCMRYLKSYWFYLIFMKAKLRNTSEILHDFRQWLGSLCTLYTRSSFKYNFTAANT